MADKCALLVEDEAMTRRAMTRLLKLKGFKVIEADSGKKGLETYTQRKDEIGIVISDCNMESADAGIVLLQEIRKDNSTIGLALNTGEGPDRLAEIKGRLVGLGIEVITKPTDLKLLDSFLGQIPKTSPELRPSERKGDAHDARSDSPDR